MPTAAEYRAFARQCIKWADATADLQARTEFLSLARDWYAAAFCLEQLDSAHGRSEGHQSRRLSN